MASRYSFEIVGPEADAALRSILRKTSMEGSVSLSFRREPNFFVADQMGNVESQVMAIRDTTTSDLIGLACRAVRNLYIDGIPRNVGYLSNLRGLPELRRGTLLARGYAYLKRVHQDGKVPYYLTTIMDENEYASNLLTSRRGGLPVYLPWGRIYTYLLPFHTKRRRFQRQGVAKGSHFLLGPAVETLNKFNRRHQFASVYTSQDLLGQTGLLPGFDSANMYAFHSGGEVTATLGIWDQSAFKQSVVTGYSPRYRLLQLVSGLGSRLGLMPRMPRTGEALPLVYGAFLSHAPGREADLIALLNATLEDWAGRGYTYLAAGVHERSPLNAVLKPLSARRLSSTLYLVYWQDLLDRGLPSSEIAPHVEVATL